jgi:RNA polymerase sigma factor (sigma-70 family)
MEINPNLSVKARQDYDIVQRALKGEQKAYAELMDRYREVLFFLLLKMVNNQSDAEDLTLEAFSKAFCNLEQYTPNFAFSTWLFRIATNNCIDYMRRRNVLSRHSNIAIDDQKFIVNIKTELPDPEELVINAQKVHYLKEVVKQMKPRYRKLLELRYFNEMSYEEIAEELKLPLGTVKAQLFRARDLLYNVLKHQTRHL